MSIYDGLKDTANILKEAGKIEQYKEILEVTAKLIEMQKEILELEQKNKELLERLEINGKLKFEDNVYYVINDNVKQGPYCTRCWDSDYKLIHMHSHQSSQQIDCPNCKTRAIPGKATVFSGNIIRHNPGR